METLITALARKIYKDMIDYVESKKGSKSKNFRPVIVVDHCAALGEDKWIDLQIREACLQCFKPCTRCVLTTIDPSTGVKGNKLQALKKLQQWIVYFGILDRYLINLLRFRLSPEGPMRQQFKDSPIF
ncbi:unnamed protein product [Haemonchus placei]|uniref:MOSC domain-containing protein n=1 Tax=Haemonchus placei TaxID=6290 RepID=A0A0N4WP31_HAEPC|nr:unnamed protein product [Haemonchus placei]